MLWVIRAEREIAREKFGYSENGSKNYPDVADGGTWKVFVANN